MYYLPAQFMKGKPKALVQGFSVLSLLLKLAINVNSTVRVALLRVSGLRVHVVFLVVVGTTIAVPRDLGANGTGALDQRLVFHEGSFHRGLIIPHVICASNQGLLIDEG